MDFKARVERFEEVDRRWWARRHYRDGGDRARGFQPGYQKAAFNVAIG